MYTSSPQRWLNIKVAINFPLVKILTRVRRLYSAFSILFLSTHVKKSVLQNYNRYARRAQRSSSKYNYLHKRRNYSYDSTFSILPLWGVMKNMRGCTQSHRRKKNHRKFPLQDWISSDFGCTRFPMKPFQGKAEQRNTIDNESSYGRSNIYPRFYPTEKLKGMRRVPVTYVVSPFCIASSNLFMSAFSIIRPLAQLQCQGPLFPPCWQIQIRACSN